MNVLVLAKTPTPGKVKTRLCPPCTPVQAAGLAKAALLDTLAAATAAASKVTLALDSGQGDGTDGWLPPGVDVVDQGGGTLNERLATAWSHMKGSTVQVGMDTPQVTAADLRDAHRRLLQPDVDAVLGLADDGGWWLIGLPGDVPGAFAGVPMSEPDTGELQHRRLYDLGLRVSLVKSCNDVDTIDDARQVAAEAPHTRYAAAFRALGL